MASIKTNPKSEKIVTVTGKMSQRTYRNLFKEYSLLRRALIVIIMVDALMVTPLIVGLGDNEPNAQVVMMFLGINHLIPIALEAFVINDDVKNYATVAVGSIKILLSVALIFVSHETLIPLYESMCGAELALIGLQLISLRYYFNESSFTA